MHGSSHHHGHDHGHGHTGTVLLVSLLATFAYIVVLLVAGIRAHSLALLSEAGHNGSDFLALLLSWVAVYFQSRPATAQKTYGYHRAGVLAAFINALTLIVVAAFIFYEAMQRLRTPVPVSARTMTLVAAVGVVLNAVIGLLVWRQTRHRDRQDVNLRSVLVHQVGDTLSTAAVIVGGIIIAQTGQLWIDPVLSLGIGVLILWSSHGIMRETLNILLEGMPRGITLEQISAGIRACTGVEDVHDLHVWSLGSSMHALSCHIAIADLPPSESDAILQAVQDCLRTRFHIHHTTVQFEHARCPVPHGCAVPLAGDRVD